VVVEIEVLIVGSWLKRMHYNNCYANIWTFAIFAYNKWLLPLDASCGKRKGWRLVGSISVLATGIAIDVATKDVEVFMTEKRMTWEEEKLEIRIKICKLGFVLVTCWE